MVDDDNFDEGKQSPFDSELPVDDELTVDGESSPVDDGQDEDTDLIGGTDDIITKPTSETGRVFEDDELTNVPAPAQLRAQTRVLHSNHDISLPITQFYHLNLCGADYQPHRSISKTVASHDRSSSYTPTQAQHMNATINTPVVYWRIMNQLQSQLVRNQGLKHQLSIHNGHENDPKISMIRLK